MSSGPGPELLPGWSTMPKLEDCQRAGPLKRLIRLPGCPSNYTDPSCNDILEIS